MNDDLVNPSNFNSILTRVPGKYVRKRWSLWDRQTYTSAATTALTFFADKLGANAGAKTKQFTNMSSNGSLPANNYFAVYGIQVTMIPAGNPANFGAQAAAGFVNDVWLMAKNGVLECTVDAKLVVQDAPLMKFPPQQQLAVAGALADVSTTGANFQSRLSYASPQGAFYKPDPFLLEPMQGFQVALSWPNGAITLAGGNPDYQVDLVGLLFSPN